MMGMQVEPAQLFYKRLANTLPLWTMPPSGRQVRRRPSSSRHPTRRRSGPAPTRATPSLPMPTTIWSTPTTRSSSTSKPAAPSARPSSAPHAPCSTGPPSASGSSPKASLPTVPTARPRTSPGWSSSGGSHRTFRCSINPIAPTAPSRDPTSCSTQSRTATPVRRVSIWCSSIELCHAVLRHHQGWDLHLPRQQARLRCLALKSRCCPNAPARKIPACCAHRLGSRQIRQRERR